MQVIKGTTMFRENCEKLNEFYVFTHKMVYRDGRLLELSRSSL